MARLWAFPTITYLSEIPAWSVTVSPSRTQPSPLAAAAALITIAIPLGSTLAVDASRSAAGKGETELALERGADADALQPYAATPDLQRALILEQTGQLSAAIEAARSATEDEPTNWRNWLVLARIEVRAGRAGAALRHYRQAKSLNPRSPIFVTSAP
jgi:Flp pilus assembly protein TadD